MMLQKENNDYSLDIKRKIVTEIENGTKPRTQFDTELRIAKSTFATRIKKRKNRGF